MNTIQSDINKPTLKPFSFTSVKKETAGETFKYWNKFLKSQTTESIEYFKEILSPTVPLSAFEEKLRLILIDTFQLKNEVVNIFISQNDFSIKKVLRCKWFFRNLSAEFCIQEIFPRVSFSVRFKIINRLSKYLENEKEAETLFSYIESNLISEGGEILLPKCSPEFILNYCKNVRPLLTRLNWKRKRILIKICKRYPELGVKVLELNYEYEKKHKHHTLENCRDSLQYLAGNHMDLLAPLFKKYYLEFDTYAWIFFKKMAWKFVKKEKDFFLQSSLCNTRMLDMKYVFSKLDTEERIKCLTNAVRLKGEKATVKSWLDAKHQLPHWISDLPPNERYYIITTVFKEVYNLNFEDQTNYWYLELLELIPTKERQHFARKLEEIFLVSEDKFLEYLNDEFCYDQKEIERAIYLYEFPVAFVKFKKLIKKTPITNRRENIMLFMLKCCKINDDTKGLEEVMDYVTENHRHETHRVLYDFAKNICDIFPDLSTSVSRKLRNLLLFCFAKGSFDIDSFSFLQEKEIYLGLESNKETDYLIKEFFEVILRSGTGRPFLSNYRNKHNRTLLLTIGEETKRWIETHSTDQSSERLHSTWIATCEQFNKVHKSNKVALTDIPGYAEVLKKLYKNKYNDLGVEDWPVEILQTCDIRGLKLDSLGKLFLHFLKKNPKLIINHLEAVLDLSDLSFYPILVKHLTLLDARDKLKELTLSKFQKEDSFHKRKNALYWYSCLCTIEEFTEVVQEYIPHEDHVKEGDARVFVRIQLAVPRVIKYIRPRWKNLDLILKFYRGDFLNQVMFSFFATCCHSRIDFILPFLKEFIYKIPPKVSYLKSIIRIIFMLSSHSEKVRFCLKFWHDNKHYSIRKIIFQFLMKMFLRDPTRELFDVIVSCVLESEAEVLADENLDRMKVPKEFLGEYALALWKASKNFTLKDDFRRVMLWNINIDNINLFPVEFCEEFIAEYLFRSKQSVKVGDFAAFYCADGQGTVESRVETIIKLMRETKANVHTVRLFLYDLRRQSHSSPAKFGIVMSIFLKNWPDSKSLYQEKFIYLYYELLYRVVKTSNERKVVSVEFGKQLRELLSGMNSLKDLTTIVAYTLKKFIKEVHRTSLPLHPLFLCRELIGDSQDNTLTDIALGALPFYLGEIYKIGEDSTNADDDKAILNEIFQLLERLNNDVFWIYFWRVFKDNKPVIPT